VNANEQRLRKGALRRAATGARASDLTVNASEWRRGTLEELRITTPIVRNRWDRPHLEVDSAVTTF
jgi:hypothetical protein